jgi:hypothetical protein
MAALSCLSIAAVEPDCVNGLIDENLIPMVRLGSPPGVLGDLSGHKGRRHPTSRRPSHRQGVLFGHQ